MLRLNSFVSAGRRALPNQWDLIAFAAILAVLTAIAPEAITAFPRPCPRRTKSPVSLDYWQLPYYALRTTLRMFAALAASLVFTFTYATLAAKSRRAEMVLIPVLDILQSVPILGFLSFTVTFFLGLFPGNTLGAELAAIFAIFTSQAWNMAFSFYQSLRTVPRRSRRSRARLPPHRLAEVLAARGAVRDAGPHLEHDDVDVGRLVLRRRLGGDHGRRHDDHPARRRLLHRQGQRRGRLVGDRRGGADDGRSSSCFTISCCSARSSPGRRSSASNCRRARTSRSSWVLSLIKRTHWLRLGFAPIAAGAARRQLLAAAFSAACAGSARRERKAPSRIIDALWILVIVAVAVWAAWLTDLLHRDRNELGRSRPGLRPDLLHLHPRRRC